jgi:hypothetical protein
VAIEGKATTITNWGRNSRLLTRIRPPAYSPELWVSSTSRPMITSALERTKKASRACELAMTSRNTERPWWASSSSVLRYAAERRSASQPTTAGPAKPMARPRAATASAERQNSSSVPASRESPMLR